MDEFIALCIKIFCVCMISNGGIQIYFERYLIGAIVMGIGIIGLDLWSAFREKHL